MKITKDKLTNFTEQKYICSDFFYPVGKLTLPRIGCRTFGSPAGYFI